MPRPSLTPAQRAANVEGAAKALETTLREALLVAEIVGFEHPEAREAFEHVETLGATIHRQSRLLAGKSKGG